ncbi:MAG: glycerophosphodiester phosphodiesterase [Chloroflexi bacterium]|nr:glycerophosphodiester phosphodiesterase [Chloroflexota bacterium]
MRQKRLRIVGITVIVITLLITLLSVVAQPVPDYPFFANDDVLVIAHQGGNLIRPDNTMVAFAHAVELGVDVLEMDIHATADGKLVIMHDATVDRTTDGEGLIKTMTLAELQMLDAAYWWSPDDDETHPYRGQGVQVPTLETVLQTFPNMPLNIEIKQTEPSIAAPFCKLLRAYDKTETVLVASFRKEAIVAFREACPEVATSMVQDEIQIFYGLHKVFLSGIYEVPGTAFQVPEYFTLPVIGELHVVNARFVRAAQAQNINVHAWTINERDDMERILATGVDGIITDRPDLLLEILGRR